MRTLALLPLLVACSVSTPPPPPPPISTSTPIYYDGTMPAGFPADEGALDALNDVDDLAGMRAHAWMIWQGMTGRVASGMPRFLTWYNSNETYGTEAQPSIDEPRRYFPLFFPASKLGEGDAIVTFNVFNAPLRTHVKNQGYDLRANVHALLGKQPEVDAFPRDSIAVKTVFWPVRADGITALPVWDDEPVRPIEWGRGVTKLVDEGFFSDRAPAEQAELRTHEQHGNDFETWKRVVAVNPSRKDIPANESTEVEFFDPEDLALQRTIQRSAKVIPLGRFFAIRLDDADVVDKLRTLAFIDEVTVRFWGRQLAVGDHLVLCASHVTTREMKEWVWTTFYWHDAADTGPFAAGKPSSIEGPFRNFRMKVTFDADRPREQDGSPHIAFNPYLEAAFSYGVHSNCLACHQRAVLQPDGKAAAVFPVRRGLLPPDDPFWTGTLRLGRLWSMAFENR